MSTCDVYKGPLKLGSGSIAGAATSITSYTSTDAKRNTMASKGFGENWMNVTVVITSSTHTGYSFKTRITADGTTSLTLANANPYAT